MNRQREVEIYIVKEEQDIESVDEVINEKENSIKLGFEVTHDEVPKFDKEHDFDEHVELDHEEYQSDDYEYGIDDVTVCQLNDLNV